MVVEKTDKNRYCRNTVALLHIKEIVWESEE